MSKHNNPRFNNGNQRNNNGDGDNFYRQPIARSGIKPVQPENKVVTYRISTEEVESYLQNKANILAKAMSEKNGIDYKFDIKIYTTDAGKRFFPFVIIIPESALMRYYDADIEDDENSIPMYDNEDITLLPEFAQFISAYSYEKADRRMIQSDSWRFDRGVSRSSKAMILSIMRPNLIAFNKGKIKKVIVMLDPCRVFHDMVVNVNNEKEQFTVDIERCKRKKIGSYLYTVKKGPKPSKQKYGNTLIHELNAKLPRTRD